MWKTVLLLLMAICVGYHLIDKTDLGEVNNKRVIVTGASKGIGEQLAYNYARLGANVIVTARSEDKLKKVIAKCKTLAPPGRIYDYIVADLGDLKSTKNVIQAAVNKLGGLDYLVLNHVGLTSSSSMWLGSTFQYERLHSSFNVNFFSYVYLATHALPELGKSKGRILVVGSLAGKIAHPTMAMYSAEKFALDGFFSSWRMELSMRNVPVSITYCVLGLIDTDFGHSVMGKSEAKNQGKFRYEYADASDTALDIIKGGINRQREVHTPYFIARTLSLLRDFIIGLFEKLVLEDMFVTD